jgi:hypothetical protein
MEKIPTAEEIMQKNLDPHDCLRPSKCYGMTLDAMIEFAKLHVEAALRTASEEAYLIESIKHSAIYDTIDKDSIINAYPLNLIK